MSWQEYNDAFGDGRALDVILLDLKLPDTTGLKLIDEVRRSGLHCPMVLMTAYGTADTVETALTAGVARVISKPFEMNRFLREIRRIIVRNHREAA